jgi:4-amino-4-deoxy-L-arabinose transferase-like glycosyltransferase
MDRFGDKLRRGARSPLFAIAAAAAVLYAVGIGWGLPASDGWDNDGVAPRDFLAGLVETFRSGHFYTYPPVHLVLLGVLTAPVTITVLAKAASLAPPDVIHEAIKVPYMTAIAYVARAVSALMAIGVAVTMAKIAEELRGRRAGVCAAAVCFVNASLCYYAHTSNLDVPYLFWGALSLLAMVRAIARREPVRLRRAAIFAVLAIGTKDQAYALFLFAVPAALALWLALDVWARQHARAIAKESGVAIAIGAALLAVVDAVVFNPSGFRARLHFLVGSASQDFAHYSNDWLGRTLVVKDAFAFFDHYYPLVFAPLIVLGAAVAIASARAEKNKLVATLVPLLAIVSFTAAFNCVARRTDHRFLMPQYVLASVYAGVAIDALAFRLAAAWQRAAARAAIAASFAAALFACAAVDVSLLFDPRYDVERWLDAHVAPGDTIEVHGNNVYFPRFPPRARVVRVGPEPLDRRNPLPGVEEVVDTFEHATIRKPKWIFVNGGWVWRYRLAPDATKSGHIMPPTQFENTSDPDGSGFFHGLYEGRRGYRVAFHVDWDSPTWPKVDIHASTAREMWVFERDDAQEKITGRRGGAEE